MASAAPEAEKKEEQEQVVNPWEVSAGKGGIDYDKLVDQFGCQRLDAAIIDRVERLTGRPPHRFLRRGLFFAHRCRQQKPYLLLPFFQAEEEVESLTDSMLVCAAGI
jgi:hypothetical protein